MYRDGKLGCGTFLLFVLIANGALADAAPTTRPAAYFPAGTWTADIYGAYTKNFVYEYNKLGSGTVGVGYYFLDNVAINAEISGYYVHQRHGPDAAIGAGQALLRHHVFQSGAFSLFLDAGAGISEASHRVPYYGTYYNYILETGIGGTYQLWDNVYLIGGARYFHLSNAALEGPRRNPGINATQGYVGILLRF